MDNTTKAERTSVKKEKGLGMESFQLESSLGASPSFSPSVAAWGKTGQRALSSTQPHPHLQT